MLFFGLLSIALSKIHFVWPGSQTELSDLREIALIIAIFHLNRWYYVPVLCVITTFGIHDGGSYVATFSMHFVALSMAYFSYQWLQKRVTDRLYLLLCWMGVVLFYFYGCMIPVMGLAYYFLGSIPIDQFFVKYSELSIEVRFEVLLSMAISTLYLLYLKTTELYIKQNDALEIAKERAEESEYLKTVFLQNLSHEVRTPINGIQGFAYLLEKNYNSEKARKKYAHLVSQSSGQLLHIVDDIIDASQIETNQIELVLSGGTLFSIKEQLLRAIGDKNRENLERVNVEFSGDSLLRFNSDFYKIGKILSQLTDNALKFSDDAVVYVSLGINDNLLTVKVQDQGIGMEDEFVHRVFEKFFQGDSGDTRNYGGNGLGLSIVKGFVDGLKGHLSFESELGLGTTFLVELPVNKA